MSTVEGEQWRVGFLCTLGASAFELANEEFADAGPVRDQTALAELAAPHDQQLPVEVDIAQQQPARLPGSQSEATGAMA